MKIRLEEKRADRNKKFGSSFVTDTLISPLWNLLYKRVLSLQKRVVQKAQKMGGNPLTRTILEKQTFVKLFFA